MRIIEFKTICIASFDGCTDKKHIPIRKESCCIESHVMGQTSGQSSDSTSQRVKKFKGIKILITKSIVSSRNQNFSIRELNSCMTLERFIENSFGSFKRRGAMINKCRGHSCISQWPGRSSWQQLKLILTGRNQNQHERKENYSRKHSDNLKYLLGIYLRIINNFLILLSFHNPAPIRV